MARSRALPSGGVTLTGAVDFISSYANVSDELLLFEKSLIAQIELEVKAYWIEAIETSKRHRESNTSAIDVRKMLEKTFIYYDPKFHKVKRGSTVNYYIYWRKAKFGYFKNESKKVRRGDWVKPNRKATTTTVAIYDTSKFELPLIAEWQRDIIERFEAKFFVLRQILKSSHNFGSTLRDARNAFDLNSNDESILVNDEDTGDNCLITDLNEIAKRLEDVGNDPDSLTKDEIDLLFKADEDQLRVAGINPIIKRIYTGINHP